MATINIEVAYARADQQKIIALSVTEGTTVESAILQSGILTIYPEINLQIQKVGIFSKACQLTDMVAANDRIEIYRPLLVDPKDARRKRAQKKRKR